MVFIMNIYYVTFILTEMSKLMVEITHYYDFLVIAQPLDS